MSSPELEQFLARLYTEAELRRRFLDDPRTVASAGNLSGDEVDALCGIDRIGLKMAAASFAAKRAQYRRRPRSILGMLLNLLRRLARH